jgi:hypothetical protein
LFVINLFPGFNCRFIALKSRNVALKSRTKFLLKFVRDISTKMTLPSFRASVSVRDLSTNKLTARQQTSAALRPLRSADRSVLRVENPASGTCRPCWRGPKVEDKVKGTTFKHRIAEVHANSMMRLSKIEAVDDPSDGAGDEWSPA